ncbi:MAG: hypothetical protein D6689_00040 [Deltaproteobacteria bacterium]|nr:MAG: hypothetical protein D6689_00040 [Deltaproteobacteria bacterium]
MSSSAAPVAPLVSSAPGKILVAGEYVVLDGAKAVVVAVTRRAVARLADEPPSLSPFLEAVRDAVDGDARDRAARVAVDTSALCDASGTKLGLGSSAAATVAAAALALGTGDPARVHPVAHRAHAAAQARRGARGSGADVAAAIYGGVLVVERTGGDDDPLAVTRAELPPGVALVAVWTGQPADTPDLVARVRALRDARPQVYDMLAARVSASASRLIRALGRDGSAADAITAIADGGEAIAALGGAAGVRLWTDAHTRLRSVARPFGAAVKPTGAGGGDIALVAAPADRAGDLRAALAAAGLPPMDLAIDPRGVTVG